MPRSRQPKKEHIPDEKMGGALCGKWVTFHEDTAFLVRNAVASISYKTTDRYCTKCIGTLEEIVEREGTE